MSTPALTRIDPRTSPLWDEMVGGSHYPQFFHHSCWIKTLVDTYHFKPLCFIVSGDTECTIPMLIVKTLKGKRKAVALPFSDGCDIHSNVFSDDLLVKGLLHVTRTERVNLLEFRGTTQFKPSKESSHSYFGHKLSLSENQNHLWKNLSSSKQRNIKKAQREPITVSFSTSHAAVLEYYRLHCITRKHHGLPPQPVSFFDHIHENIIMRDLGEVGLVSKGTSVIGGAIYLFSKREALYKFGASDRNHQQMRANDLLMWEAITRYAKRGFATFSFGKTESFHLGLIRFKEGFGAKRIVMNDYCYDVRSGERFQDAPSVNGIHNLVFGRMPIPLLRLCGEIIYKYSA